MSLKAKTAVYATYRSDAAKYKISLLPAMSTNGTWMAEGAYSCRGSSSLRYESNLYRVFNGQYYSSDVSDFNENIYIDICLPKAIALRGADMYSYYQALPAAGIVYYSDDGETYTECGTWKDETTTSQNIAAAWGNVGAHRIWRFVSASRSNKYPAKNADITYASLWYYDEFDIDYDLPEGAGGFQSLYATYLGSGGVDIKQDIYLACRSDTVKSTGTLLPDMSSNGTWMAEEAYSCRGSDGLDSISDIYKVFNTTWSSSYVNKFNADAYIDLCLPEAKTMIKVELSSSDRGLPETGKIYYSDDGETYIECGTWQDMEKTSKSATATLNDDVGAHRVWRVMSTGRAAANPSYNADITVAKFTWLEKFDIDYSLPKGIGIVQSIYATLLETSGVNIKQDVYFTYKRDELVNLWEGKEQIDFQVAGDTKCSSAVEHCLHGDTDAKTTTAVVLSADTSIKVLDSWQMNNDLARAVIRRESFSLAADAARLVRVLKDMMLNADTQRKVYTVQEVLGDTARIVKVDMEPEKFAVSADTTSHITASYKINNDLLRKVYKRAVFSIAVDTARIVRINRVHIYADASRKIVASYSIGSGLLRTVQRRAAFSFSADTSRGVLAKGNFDLAGDAARMLKCTIGANADTELKRRHEFSCDTAREIGGSFEIDADTCLRLPFDTTFTLPANREPVTDPFAVPRAGQKDGMVSMAISLNELSLSDTFELETTMTVDVLDAIRGTVLDFPYSYVIGETDWSGRTISATGMYDVDSILYTPMTYTTANVKRKASWHAQKIADSLGKNLNLAISDFTHSSTWVGKGQTYESIISSLFGWTSAIPHRQVNVFLRAAGNTLNVVQRGYESRVVDITNAHHTRPEYHREVVRTMWSYKSDDGSGSRAHGINIEPTPFTGTLTFGDATASYASGYLTEETVNGETTTYSYSGFGSTRYVTGKVCVHKDGSITKTDYSFAGTEGGISVLGSETETTMDKSGKSQTVRKTIHAPLGNGFYGTSVYVDDEYMGSSISTGSPAATASRYLLNQESLSMGGAHYGKGSSDSNSLLEEANFPVEEEQILLRLTDEIKWLNRRIKETVTMDIYNYGHVLDFTERIAFRGHEYYLVSNRITRTVRELKQTVTIVRWQ